jgi:hypothetical protein
MVIEGKSELGKADPCDSIGWIYRFIQDTGESKVVVKVSSLLSNRTFKGHENQMHDETIKFAFRKIREEPDATELTFNPEDFESPPENPPLTGRNLRIQVLKFICEVNDELTERGVSVYDLMHNFPNRLEDLRGVLSYFERKGYLESLGSDSNMRYQTASHRVMAPSHRIDPSRLDDIEAELHKAELKPTQPTTVSGGLDGKMFDVGLSFAGEDREYVERVHKVLEAEDIEHFYYPKYKPELFAERSTLTFPRIFGDQCQLAAVFISKHYVEKIWPTEEWLAIRMKAAELKGKVFILPFKLDDSEPVGFPRDIIYEPIGKTKMPPEECARMIIAKVKGLRNAAPSQTSESKQTTESRREFERILKTFERKWRAERNGAKRLVNAVPLLTELADSLHGFLDDERSRIEQVAVESIERSLSEISRLEAKERTYRAIGKSNDGYFDEGQEVISGLKQVEL